MNKNVPYFIELYKLAIFSNPIFHVVRSNNYILFRFCIHFTKILVFYGEIFVIFGNKFQVVVKFRVEFVQIIFIHIFFGFIFCNSFVKKHFLFKKNQIAKNTK